MAIDDDDKKRRELFGSAEHFWKEAQTPMMKFVRSTIEAANRLRAMTETPGFTTALESARALADRINAAAESPAAKEIFEQAKAISESPVMKAIAESQRLQKLTAHVTAVDKLTAHADAINKLVAPVREYEDLLERQKTYRREAFASVATQPRTHQPIQEVESADERDAALQRQRIFVALVQTRALFHDCQQVMKLKQGESYSALAPNIVLAAFDLPIDEIDEDVGQHAEAFVRAGVKGATG